MSDHIPFELQSEITKRLPVKSLIQFRSVCKPWKSLIDSSDFVKHYSGQQQHLLVRYQDAVDHKEKYVSIVDDDDTFPMQKVTVTIPPFVVNMLKHSTTMGSSHGLLCLYNDDMAVIWNPSISKAVAVVFGVCRETLDPKIVKINYVLNPSSDIECVVCIPEVFTLSTGAWRSPYGSFLPRKSIRFSESRVAVDGVLYWLADDGTSEYNYSYLIILFDITSEEFKEVNLPDRLARNHARYLSIFKLRNTLAVLQFDVREITLRCMDDDGRCF
ncbi:putative F-box domain-containing protein [Helianthus annuus]|nr:putative F-box domain-containing protein [Helianthus annuus]